MVKPGFGFLQGRRKSSGNPMDDANLSLAADSSPVVESSGFRVLNTDEADRRKAEQALKKTEKSKFGRFSGFGSGPKGRSMSVDEDSPSSSKRDSKSSSGTYSSRPYHPSNYGGSSSSTLPSSADTDMNDNMFANLPPRPPIAQHGSSPSLLSMGAVRKELPNLPKSRTTDMSGYYVNSYGDVGHNTGRNRGMTASSYASTAIPPKLETDLDFGNSGFDDLFSGMSRKDSPDIMIEPPGRSLLAGKRQVQAEPIKIDRKLEVEPPPTSWDSRGSNENLISSPTDDHSPPPPPVPKHKYAPIASHSPELNASGRFEDEDARLVRQSVVYRKSVLEHSSEQKNTYTSSSSANSLQTPLSSRSTSNNTTPKAPFRAAVSPAVEEDEDNIFAPVKLAQSPERKPAKPAPREHIPQPPAATGDSSRRVMTAAEFQAQKRYQMTQPVDESSDEEDYEDEEEAIEQRLKEDQARREQQRMQMARDHLRRSTTAPADPNRPASGMGTSFMGNGFPSEISKDADQWDDEDVPLGILKEHGFPSRGKAPAQPANATQSYFRTSTPTMPDRPASAGAAGAMNRGSGYRPPFARGLPDDPHSSFIGGGIVLPTNRESMGFNRAASVYGEPTGGMPYQDSQQPYTSLVDQIHMRDMTKQKYMGGASSKNKPQQGPFTGLLGNQGQTNQNQAPTRMPQMPMQGMQSMHGMQGMNGMNGMNPMMNMMGGGMPMMGMNQMQYPMANQNDLMQLQSMLFAQSMQQAQQMMQANAMMGHQMPQDPRMSMAPQQNLGMPGQNFGNNNFLNVGPPGGMNPQRPMSIMSFGGSQQNRPYSTPGAGGMAQGGFQPQMGPNAGYTPSIAPSERSNIGLASRYRPVITGNGMGGDAVSTVSSKTLQASGGASATSTQKVKGILKKSPVTQVTVREDDEDDWAKMQARRNKFGNGGAKRNDASGLQELAHAVDGF